MFAMAFFGEPDETAPAVDGRRQGEVKPFCGARAGQAPRRLPGCEG